MSRCRPHRLTGPLAVRVLPLLLVATILGSACSQQGLLDDETMELPKDPPPVTGTVGTPVDLFGVELDVLSIGAFEQSPESFPRLRMTMRTENTTDKTLRNPDVDLWCDEAEEGGEWYMGSTWEANALLPPQEVNEGEIYVGFPRKPDSDRYAVPTCTNARVVVTATETGDRRRQVANYRIDPEVIEAAIDAPHGRGLPLPPSSS